MHIGLDLDNTIVIYDSVFLKTAKQTGLLAETFDGSKKDLRDAIRRLEDGETEWQRLQGQVYGAHMKEAEIADGVGEFLKASRAGGHSVSIISHKTVHGHFDPQKINLRDAALDWLQAQSFFDPQGFGLDPGDVTFEDTRADKIRRIAASGCTLFIDDLTEVLEDAAFPAGVERLLYAPGGEVPTRDGIRAFRSWRDLQEAVFGNDD